MRKRFVVLLSRSVDAEDKKFIAYVTEQGLTWWHWFSNSWLLVGDDTEITAAEIRDAIGQIFSKKRCFVIELTEENSTWAGNGPQGEPKNMFKWINKNWHE